MILPHKRSQNKQRTETDAHLVETHYNPQLAVSRAENYLF
jgi:hypothetical protein